MPTHYEVLGVSKTATLDDIKKKYRELARTHHPDKAKNPGEKARLEDLFASITTAYNTLKDPETRAKYDSTQGGSPSAGATQGETGAPPPPGAAADQAATNGVQQGGGVDLAKGRKEVAMRAYAQGVKLFQLGEYARAADFLRAAIQSHPDEAQFQDRLAVALLKCKKSFSEAVAAAKRASELDPYKSDYKIHLAELYEAIGSQENATQTYQEVLKWDPDNQVAKAKVKGSVKSNSTWAKFKEIYLKIVGR